MPRIDAYQYPNVSCKLSGMVTEAGWGTWKAEDFHPYLDAVLEAFGTERVMIGSDWPVCTLSGDYASTMGIVTDYVRKFSSDIQAAILGGNCSRIYRLSPGNHFSTTDVTDKHGWNAMNHHESMKAALLYGANDIRIESIPVPDLEPDQVLLRLRRVGICGSDLHYYAHGECGPFVPDRPFVLGHELSAEVAALGAAVTTLTAGQRVTANPARSCGRCHVCKTGRPNLCRNLIMLGSASPCPPVNGGMAEFVVLRADQCHVLPVGMDDGLAAMMEPFAVALHAVKRAGVVAGKRVLVVGGGHHRSAHRPGGARVRCGLGHGQRCGAKSPGESSHAGRVCWSCCRWRKRRASASSTPLPLPLAC